MATTTLTISEAQTFCYPPISYGTINGYYEWRNEQETDSCNQCCCRGSGGYNRLPDLYHAQTESGKREDARACRDGQDGDGERVRAVCHAVQRDEDADKQRLAGGTAGAGAEEDGGTAGGAKEGEEQRRCGNHEAEEGTGYAESRAEELCPADRLAEQDERAAGEGEQQPQDAEHAGTATHQQP